MKGSYILVLELARAIDSLRVGRLGQFPFAAGYYLYVGSAFGAGGLAARIGHHASRQKARPHWHIDYLRAEARLREAWTVSGPDRLECRWCAALAAEPAVSAPVARFGSRDTGCRSHLFYMPGPPRSSLLCRVILAGLVDSPAEIKVEVHSFEE